jgi:hypothetical protein
MIKVKVILGIIVVSNSACLPITQNESMFQREIMGFQAQNKEQNPILDKDYTIAKRALDKAVLQRDKETIRLGLKRDSLDFKREVVHAIEQLKDKLFVPDLINALEGNQITMRGGTETKLLQQELNEAIVSALKKVTNINFLISDKLSTDDIQQVLKKSREWWKVNKEE